MLRADRDSFAHSLCYFAEIALSGAVGGLWQDQGRWPHGQGVDGVQTCYRARVHDFNALIVSYAFPPVGGAGVQRSAKLVKFLPTFGISPSVLTVSNPSVPVRDDAMLGDVPSGTRIVRAPTLEPGEAAKQATWQDAAQANVSWLRRVRRSAIGIARQILIPDPQVLWLPGAVLALKRELKNRHIDCVVISAPPFSQFSLAPAIRVLSPSTGIVLDYRDEWSTARSTYEMVSATIPRLAGEALEERFLRAAHCVTTATEGFRQNLLASHSFLHPDRVTAITNGYDPDDFAHAVSAPPLEQLTLTYAGTIFKLTSAAGLLAAVRLIHERDPLLGKLLSLRFVGRVVETEQRYFAGLEDMGVKQVGYVAHDRVVGELASGHVTLCLLDDVPGVERIYPAKIFELMQLDQPVMALAPEGELSRLVRRHNLGVVIPPRDVQAIAAQLSRWLEDFRSGVVPRRNGYDPASIVRYHRKTIAGEFVEVMRRAASIAGRA